MLAGKLSARSLQSSTLGALLKYTEQETEATRVSELSGRCLLVPLQVKALGAPVGRSPRPAGRGLKKGQTSVDLQM